MYYCTTRNSSIYHWSLVQVLSKHDINQEHASLRLTDTYSQCIYNTQENNPKMWLASGALSSMYTDCVFYVMRINKSIFKITI